MTVSVCEAWRTGGITPHCRKIDTVTLVGAARVVQLMLVLNR